MGNAWTNPTPQDQSHGTRIALSTLDRELWNRPWGRVGFARVTANQSGITAIADLTSLTVTFLVPIAGRTIKIVGYGNFQATGAASQALYIRESATQLAASSRDVTNGNPYSWDVAVVLESPTEGSHTYKLSVSSTASTTLIASATQPAFILAEDIGPVTVQ